MPQMGLLKELPTDFALISNFAKRINKNWIISLKPLQPGNYFGQVEICSASPGNFFRQVEICSALPDYYFGQVEICGASPGYYFGQVEICSASPDRNLRGFSTRSSTYAFDLFTQASRPHSLPAELRPAILVRAWHGRCYVKIR